MKSLSVLFLALIAVLTIQAQQGPLSVEQIRKAHHEVPDMPYMPNEFGNKKTTPAARYKSATIFTTQVNVDANGNNIVGDAANEPSIAVNPVDPDQIVIGWRQFDNVNSNFRQAGYGYSADAGQTWTFPGSIQPGVFRSDPVLEFSNQGTSFYNSLTSNNGSYFCRVFRSADGGANWDDGVEARGGDKQWMVIDKSESSGEGFIHSFWTSFYSSCTPDHFTRSTDGGSSYEECVSIPGNPYWGTMAVGKNGELFVTGSGAWGGPIIAKATAAWDPSLPVQWDYWVPVNLDGYSAIQSPINPVGLMGQMNVDVDRSESPGSGNVYVLGSVTRNSNGDPGDVMFASSADGGMTWSDPVRVNDDPGTGAYQWFGTMSVAPDGRIDAVWLDTRDDIPQGFMSSLYYSYSLDEGETWSANLRLSEAFDPHVGWPQQQKMGDYFDMESDLHGVHLAWANTLNGEQDVYYSYITPEFTGIGRVAGTNDISLHADPNPACDFTRITCILADPGDLTIRLVNTLGNEVLSLYISAEKAGSVSRILPLQNLDKGLYIIIVHSEKHTIAKKLVIR